MFTAKESRDMTKMLEQIMKPEVHGGVFANHSWLLLGYKALIPSSRENGTSTASDYKEL